MNEFYDFLIKNFQINNTNILLITLNIFIISFIVWLILRKITPTKAFFISFFFSLILTISRMFFNKEYSVIYSKIYSSSETEKYEKYLNQGLTEDQWFMYKFIKNFANRNLKDTNGYFKLLNDVAQVNSKYYFNGMERHLPKYIMFRHSRNKYEKLHFLWYFDFYSLHDYFYVNNTFKSKLRNMIEEIEMDGELIYFEYLYLNHFINDNIKLYDNYFYNDDIKDINLSAGLTNNKVIVWNFIKDWANNKVNVDNMGDLGKRLRVRIANKEYFRKYYSSGRYSHTHLDYSFEINDLFILLNDKGNKMTVKKFIDNFEKDGTINMREFSVIMDWLNQMTYDEWKRRRI